MNAARLEELAAWAETEANALDYKGSEKASGRLRALPVVVVPCRASVLCPPAYSCILFHERAITNNAESLFV